MSDEASQERILRERKEKFFAFFKNNYNWVSYILLAFVVFIAVKIRSSNIGGLRDVTTGGWTLGPDLDPFLFLRWAKEIVANGTLYTVDTFRYVPLGFNTNEELLFHPYLIAWFHKFASIFGSTSVEQSAALYPVFMFALTVIAFFAMVRVMFKESLGETRANIIALISSFFLTVIPSLLPRTIAGIPEKESAAFLFMFLSFYLFIAAWKSQKNMSKYTLALLAGISTALMALIWGGFTYIFVTLGLTMFVSFLLGQVSRDKLYIYVIWLFSASLIMSQFSARFSFANLITSTTTGLAFFTLLLLLVDLALSHSSLNRHVQRYDRLSKLPSPVISILLTVVLGLIFVVVFFGPSFISEKLGGVVETLVTPVSDRLGVTVAENRQPYFTEWSGSFGPYVRGIPIFFWLFFFGSIYLFHFIMRVYDSRERWILTSAYTLFLIALIFSRYSTSSVLQGTNATSLFVYFLGFAVLIGAFGFQYLKSHKRGDSHRAKEIEFGLILLFSLFFLSIVSARGAVRLIMVMVPPTSIIVAYFVVSLVSGLNNKDRDDLGKMLSWIIAALVVLSVIFAGYQFYNSSLGMAKGYVPSSYTQQWQKAMDWTRDNTPQNSVFAHWWDYGYWVQTIGERATILDGGNAIPYWDYLMGRHVLTAMDYVDTMSFLYTHNATHLLIDSTDIGKYGAFSSIGSDENYDRRSWMSFFAKQRVEERKNSTVYLYQGQFPLDQDLIYNYNGTLITLPEGRSAVLGFLIERQKNSTTLSQPIGVFYYQKNQNTNPEQYSIPIRYAYYGNQLYDFQSGLEAGVFMVPYLDAQRGSIDKEGIILFLSNKTVNGHLARLYLFEENNQYFTLAHSEDDFAVAQLKQQGALQPNEDFIYYEGLRGPLRIWNIKYPAGLSPNPEFLRKDYPNPDLLKA